MLGRPMMMAHPALAGALRMPQAPGMMPIRTRGMGFPRLGGALAGMSGRHFAEGGSSDDDPTNPGSPELAPPSSQSDVAPRHVSYSDWAAMPWSQRLDRIFPPDKRSPLGLLADKIKAMILQSTQAAPAADQMPAPTAPAAGANGALANAVPGMSSIVRQSMMAQAPQSQDQLQQQGALSRVLAGVPIVPYDTASGLTQAGYASGGHTRGPGDGTSDDIPAMLSDGEFVIPADVVSHLGNGSNDAGAKALDGMLTAVRKHKATGEKFPPKAKPPLSYIKGRGIQKAEGGALSGIRRDWTPTNPVPLSSDSAAVLGARG